MAVIDTARLDTALRAAGLPIDGLGVDGETVNIFWQTQPTQQQLDTAAAIAADPYWKYARRQRSLWDIAGDLNALTAQQKTNVWNDLSAGTPARYKLDVGTNAGAISVLDLILAVSGLTGANLTNARLRLAACYVQDNPAYLKTPGFDGTINVLGDEQVP